ncbi:hypothetical protein ABZT17_00305 [Streptomyces sp. NPDC005648]|uniref:hypothetical protein n=1 Tax=Streptomyces sp. NPDC005648 TaxID=3157044 RepID=UPI0033B312B1
MAEEAGTDADDACAWAERLGWAFGLISEDPAARGAALVHLAEAQRKVLDALARSNEMWLLTRPLGADKRYREPACVNVLLFLEWEARDPLEWTQHAKAWGTKQSLIRKVARARQEEAIKAKLTDLVEIVVHRAYRCKDREYVRVARAVDSADLRGRLDRAADSDSPWARCHAGALAP